MQAKAKKTPEGRSRRGPFELSPIGILGPVCMNHPEEPAPHGDCPQVIPHEQVMRGLGYKPQREHRETRRNQLKRRKSLIYFKRWP